MGAWSFSRSSAYSVELSLETVETCVGLFGHGICRFVLAAQLSKQTDTQKHKHTLVPDIKGSDGGVDAVHSQGQDLCGMGQVWTQLVLSGLCHCHMTLTL